MKWHRSISRDYPIVVALHARTELVHFAAMLIVGRWGFTFCLGGGDERDPVSLMPYVKATYTNTQIEYTSQWLGVFVCAHYVL